MIKREGEQAPLFYGYCYSDPCRLVTIFYLWPFNHVIKWTRELYFLILYCNPTKREQRELDIACKIREHCNKLHQEEVVELNIKYSNLLIETLNKCNHKDIQNNS